MPGRSTLAYGNEVLDFLLYAPAVTFPTLAANASGTNTFNVPGGSGISNVLPGDFFSWNLQAPPAHLIIDNVYCSAPGVLTILWSSDSTGISTGSVAVLFEWIRFENINVSGIAGIPQALT